MLLRHYDTLLASYADEEFEILISVGDSWLSAITYYEMITLKILLRWRLARWALPLLERAPVDSALPLVIVFELPYWHDGDSDTPRRASESASDDDDAIMPAITIIVEELRLLRHTDEMPQVDIMAADALMTLLRLICHYFRFHGHLLPHIAITPTLFSAAEAISHKEESSLIRWCQY